MMPAELVVPVAAVNTACAAIGDPDLGLPPAAWRPWFMYDRNLHVVVPSTGAAMVFAAALAAELMDAAWPNCGTAAGLALEVMARASDDDHPHPGTCPPGYLVIYFPGVSVDPCPAGWTR
jgi:hypothetical protein